MTTFSPPKAVLFALLLALSGCGRAEVSDARKDYLLAKEHGWVELTLDIAPPLINPEAQKCVLEATINGETFLTEPLFPAGNPDKSIKTGFLFVAPAAQNTLVLDYSLCQKTPQQTSIKINLPTNNLVRLNFDGKTLTASAPESYTPASLATLNDKLQGLHDAQIQNQDAIMHELAFWLKGLVAAVLVSGAFVVFSLLRVKKSRS